ncbi:MAG: septum formation protein Maf [Chloroflexi bacterium UTCFX4]|jgi:septum formation protein|nr:MAG: septum formation protein Maf [Chloroflexi bacterium UTCFX4]
MTKQIVLASASPRRRELLKQLAIEFTSVATDIEETQLPEEHAPNMVARLARLKALAAQRQFPNALVIAADTDVELDGAILGKPRDAADARAMLTALRQRAHNVFTGFTIADGARCETEIAHTRVFMRDYSDAEITTYIASGDPFDKAAGYAAQHPDLRPVARVDGCFANVMGMPLCRLYHALERHIEMPAPRLECLAHSERDCSVEKTLFQVKS